MFQRVAAALVFATLTGQITDRTTGQPLSKVNVEVAGKRTVTDGSGRYSVKGVVSGVRWMRIGSKDVPSERFRVTIKAPTTRYDMRACSTTLDYSCSGPAGAMQNG